MDHVDSNLATILHEVNTLEEFETEKTVFQVRIIPLFLLLNNNRNLDVHYKTLLTRSMQFSLHHARCI